jgi:hypothetical protein
VEGEAEKGGKERDRQTDSWGVEIGRDRGREGDPNKAKCISVTSVSPRRACGTQRLKFALTHTDQCHPQPSHLDPSIPGCPLHLSLACCQPGSPTIFAGQLPELRDMSPRHPPRQQYLDCAICNPKLLLAQLHH